jgi:hypothetical protein
MCHNRTVVSLLEKCLLVAANRKELWIREKMTTVKPQRFSWTLKTALLQVKLESGHCTKRRKEYVPDSEIGIEFI